jgi:exonuclease III
VPDLRSLGDLGAEKEACVVTAGDTNTAREPIDPEEPMNSQPTEATVRAKLEYGGALFASDEVQLLVYEIDALRAWATGQDLPQGWRPPTYKGPTYVA